MSVVYKAQHTLMGNLVAIKVLQERLSDDAAYQKRFLLEAKSTILLEDPNIIRVFDFGMLEGGASYLVMEYVDGQSLSEIITKQHHLEPEQAIGIFKQIAKGLAHAHAKGILHRDLKPSNVIAIHEGDELKIKVVDFGIAKMIGGDGAHGSLTVTGEVLGSPNYMSPEQCLGRQADARSDIYSMGCLMYEALTGKAPHTGNNVLETLHKHINETPEPITQFVRHPLAKQLSIIVNHAMEKDPDKRYQSFDELVNDLSELEQGRSIASKRRSTVGLRNISIAGTIAIAACTAAVICFFFSIKHDAPQSTQPPSAVPAAPTAKPTLAELEEKVQLERAQLFACDLDDSDLDKLHLSNRTQLRTINLRNNPKITSAGAIKLLSLPNLRWLMLDGTSVDDTFLAQLHKAPQLQSLTIGNTKVTSAAFNNLKKLPKLRELWLMELNLTDRDMQRLPTLAHLFKLKLDDNPAITHETLGIIYDRAPNTQFWSIRGCPKINNDAALIFTKFPKRRGRIIQAHGTSMTADAATILNRVGIEIRFDATPNPGSKARLARATDTDNPGIENGKLTPGECKLFNNKEISPEKIAELVSVPTRTIIVLEGTLADDAALEALQNHIDNIELLALGQSGITPEGFQQLSGANQLQKLELNDLDLTDADLQQLPALPNLTVLRLDGNTKLTAAGLEVLNSKFPQLGRLAIRRTNIGDEIVPALKKFPKLIELPANSTKISADTINLFAGKIAIDLNPGKQVVARGRRMRHMNK